MKPLIRDISAELKAVLDSQGHKRSYRQGQAIFHENDPAESLPIVLSGSVKMFRSPQPGKEVIVGIFKKGEMFAIPPVFDGGDYPASAVALEPTDLLLIGRKDFLETLRTYSEFAFAVIDWTCDMLREKTAIIQNLATSSPEHRVAHVLVKLSRNNGDRFPFKVPVRRQDIAEMANLTTETTIRVIRHFAELGLVRIEHGKVLIDGIAPLEQFLQ